MPIQALHEVLDFTDDILVTVPIGNHMFGETPIRDLAPICAIVRRLAPLRIFEFGTFTGSTTRAIILNAPPTSEIWTLDLDLRARKSAAGLNSWNKKVDDGIIGKYFREIEESSRIHQLFSNSLDFDTKPFRASMDLIFVDASHSYPYVVNDTAKAFEMISPGGTILWHDYPNFAGVKRHLEELPTERRATRILDTILAIFTDRPN